MTYRAEQNMTEDIMKSHMLTSMNFRSKNICNVLSNFLQNLRSIKTRFFGSFTILKKSHGSSTSSSHSFPFKQELKA